METNEKVVYHPNGTRLTFYEDTHVYQLDDGTKFTSGTQYIKKFFPEFDKDSVSKMYAEKNSMDQKDVLDKWKEKGIKASKFGTAVHAYAEYKLIDKIDEYLKMDFGLDDEQLERFPSYIETVDRAIDLMLDRYNFVSAEHIVFSPEEKIAGTIDLLMYDPPTSAVIILDWKTNKKIDKYNQWRTALPPFQNKLTDCEFDKYSCQLNLYRRLLLQEGYVEQGQEIRMGLIHIMSDDYSFMKVPEFDV